MIRSIGQKSSGYRVPEGLGGSLLGFTLSLNIAPLLLIRVLCEPKFSP